MEELNIRSLIDIHRLQRIQDRFAEATGLAMISVDQKGVPITAASAFTPFCSSMRADSVRQRRCFNCDAHGGLQSAIDGKPYLYQCHSGLVDFSVPIMVGDQYLGAILCGQVKLAEGQDELDFVTAQDTSWQADERLAAMFEAVQVSEVSKLHSIAETLFEIATYLVEKEYVNTLRTALHESELQSIRTSSERTYLRSALQQAQVRMAKDTADAPEPADDAAPQDDAVPSAAPDEPAHLAVVREPRRDAVSPFDFRLLERAVEDEDLVEAYRVLALFLDIVFQGSGRYVGRLRLSEIEDRTVEIARERSPQIGWEVHQRVLRHRTSQYAQLTRYAWQTYLESLLGALLGAIERRGPRRQRTITDLLNHVEQNACKAPTLMAAAAYMSVSPSHLSKTFKARTGTTFTAYVNAKRMERAKLMLATTDYAIVRIATELSFSPVNYFSRSFKKYTGLTPSEYRQQESDAAQEESA